MSRLVQETRWRGRVMDCLWTSESEIDRSGCRSGVGVHLFVVFYEEPMLRKKFGADYQE